MTENCIDPQEIVALVGVWLKVFIAELKYMGSNSNLFLTRHIWLCTSHLTSLGSLFLPQIEDSGYMSHSCVSVWVHVYVCVNVCGWETNDITVPKADWYKIKTQNRVSYWEICIISKT